MLHIFLMKTDSSAFSININHFFIFQVPKRTSSDEWSLQVSCLDFMKFYFFSMLIYEVSFLLGLYEDECGIVTLVNHWIWDICWKPLKITVFPTVQQFIKVLWNKQSALTYWKRTCSSLSFSSSGAQSQTCNCLEMSRLLEELITANNWMDSDGWLTPATNSIRQFWHLYEDCANLNLCSCHGDRELVESWFLSSARKDIGVGGFGWPCF